jgi:hypothetical protein
MAASHYAGADAGFIDYQVFEHPSGLVLRGPAPGSLPAGGYIAFAGAAQTFGRYCERPFPTIVGDELGVPVLNLGVGGAGPAHFLDPRLLDLLNGSRFAVLQVMSARGEGNSRMTTTGNRFVRVEGGGAPVSAERAWGPIVASEPPAVIHRLIAETRQSWVESYSALLQALSVPVVLLYVSKRTPDYREQVNPGRRLRAVWGQFPHLVNRAMIDALRPQVVSYVECVSRRGLPQPIWDRSTGGPLPGGRTYNTYYPSPEMHEDVAGLLGPVCRVLWRGETPPAVVQSGYQQPRGRVLRRVRTMLRRLRRRLGRLRARLR